MKQFLPVLSCSPLMKGITPEEALRLLTCLDSQLMSFQKGNIILQQDDPAKYFGIVLAGSVQGLRGDMQGSHTIIAEIQNGELFGETFASPIMTPAFSHLKTFASERENGMCEYSCAAAQLN